MSAFAMCWNRTGGAVPVETVRTIRECLDRGGPGALRERSGADWAAWSCSTGWAGDAEAGLPMEHGGWAGTGALRLDARPSLAARIRDRVGEGPTDDASLAWRSLAAWGDEAPSHWLGDYAVCAIAPDRSRAVLARGTLGVVHCFHAAVGDLVLVAGDPEPLRAALDAARGAASGAASGAAAGLEDRAVAEYLAHGGIVTPGLTFHRGIKRVPPAHTCTIGRDGRERQWRHWSLPAPGEREGLAAEAIVEEFREVAVSAVRDRLRAPRAGLLLSGGLDSPLLATTLRAAAPAVPVTALTMSWRRLLPSDREAEWAARAAATMSLPHEVMDMAPDAGFDDDRPIWTPEPSPDPETRVWRRVSARLAELGPVALLGEDLDALLAPPTLAQQLAASGLLRTLHAWRAYVRETGRRPWIGLRHGVRTSLRSFSRATTAIPAWVPERLRALLPAASIERATRHPTRERAAAALAQPIWEQMLWDDDPAMTGAPVRVVLPFMDARVIGFLFSLPPVPWAQRKHLVRAALRGRMPDALAEREKVPLAGYYAARVGAWRDRGAPAPLPVPMDDLIDVRRWRDALTSADPDRVYEAWRVLELSRWLAQPPRRPR